MRVTTRLLATAAITALAAATVVGCDSEAPADAGAGTAPAPTSTEVAEADSLAHNAADTEFAQMMIIHHEGAIEMADLAVAQASTAEVRELGERISQAQGPEIELMRGWLQAWGEPPAEQAGHHGMDHSGMDMDGLDQAGAMASLEAVDGMDFDRLFLELMIAHHNGAILMSEEQLDAGQHPEALELAMLIMTAQETEIAEMQLLLRQL